MKKKILSLLLAVVMLVSVMPMSAISAYAAIYTRVSIDSLDVGDIVKRGGKIEGDMRGSTINGKNYGTSDYTTSTCVKVTAKSNRFKATITNVCNSNIQGTLKTAATCTAAAVYNYKCSICGYNTATKSVGSPLDHNYTKQGTLVSDATIDSPAIYNKQCATCTATNGIMEVGDKLPSMKVNYVDPITGETVDLGDLNESTNDEVKDTVNTLVSMPIQKKNQIFTGWYTDKGALDKNTTRFEEFTNITAGFFEIVTMAKDERDEKAVDDYLTFELAGVQIREENTKEVDKKDVYGGLRFVASLSDDIMNNLDIIQYGFAVTTRANAEANANGKENYVIKNKDKNVRLVNCMGMTDHRTFKGNYRLYTMVIDYEGNEALKDEEMVVRPYIAYRDANGVARIFYGSYRGTNTYGGLSTSYNIAKTL